MSDQKLLAVEQAFETVVGSLDGRKAFRVREDVDMVWKFLAEARDRLEEAAPVSYLPDAGV